MASRFRRESTGWVSEVFQNEPKSLTTLFPTPHSDQKKPANAVSRRESRNFSTLPYEAIAYLAINTFGLSMIYPGSVKLLQKFMSKMRPAVGLTRPFNM